MQEPSWPINLYLSFLLLTSILNYLSNVKKKKRLRLSCRGERGFADSTELVIHIDLLSGMEQYSLHFGAGSAMHFPRGFSPRLSHGARES